MAGTLTELSVACRLAARALGRRLRSEIEPPPDLASFRADLESILRAAPQGVVRDHAWIDMPAELPPWQSANMNLAAGDEVSYFIAGRVYASRLLDIYLGPALQVWVKVGEHGEVFRGTRDSHSFRAADAGLLQFGNYFPNDWSDPQGTRLQDDAVYRGVSGAVRILVIRWQQSALDGLHALAASNAAPACVRAELARIEQAEFTPRGWHYLWHLGPAEIFREARDADGGACIACHTRADVGILQKDVELALDERTEISWRWCLEQLPSTLREDALPSHDYLSIAVEFDNGRDITYYWSAELPVGTGYDCPLPNWRGKEFHVVVRSGAGGLGQWHEERRNLYQDYRHYMGEPPGRVVRVWFIANSIFQRGTGSCRYADIRLGNAAEAVQVL